MASIKFKNVYLDKFATISSQNEKINTTFTMEDFFLGEDTIEATEIKMQKKVLDEITKNKNIDIVIGADLSNQLGITSETMLEYNISLLGVYSACSSFVEELIISGLLIDKNTFKEVATIISSHNLSAERTFRYPIEYGAPRRFTQSFTATGAVATVITKTQTNIKLESATIGKVTELGIKDVNNMGAIMAPGAVNTLIEHLKDLKRDVDYYDIILTGDLGKLGTELFKEILTKNDITLKNHIDAGSILISDPNLTDQGASGPVCLPLVFLEKILTNKKYKRILLIGTGSLHNTTLVNQKKPLPCISHAISLEVL